MCQMDRERVILPIWHNINKEFIREKSLYLLDIKALSSEMGWDKLVDAILEVIRPDIINSHLMLNMGIELHKRAKELPKVEIPANQLFASPIRHKTLPVHLIIATRLISEVFSLLLAYSQKGQLEEISSLKKINEREYYFLIKLFVDDYKHIMDMIKKYN